MNILIIYEDKNIVAVNKPAGLVVHSDGRTREATLADWILERYPELEHVGEPVVQSSVISHQSSVVKRPGIVHRLDKDTSGILLIAKNQNAFLFFKKQFQEQKIQKTYKILVYGRLKDDGGVIDAPIARSTKDFRMRASAGVLRGKPRGPWRGKEREAITEYKVLAKNDAYSFVEAYPKTGRTHQIRVHMKSIGHPIVCDPFYAPKRKCPEGLGRLALHAYALEFETPRGARLRLEAPLTEDIKHFAQTQFPAMSKVAD